MQVRILALGALSTFTACLEMRHEITLQADGSGVQRLELALTPDVLATARAFAAASQTDLRGRAPDDVFREANVARELTEAGLALTEYRTRKERRAEFVEITATFDSFATLCRSPLSGPRAQWRLERTADEAVLRLLFWPQGEAAHAAATEQAAELERDRVDAAMRSYFERQRQKIAGLDLTFVLHLPGDVQGCGGGCEKIDARTVRVAITADDVQQPADLVRLLAPRFEVRFTAGAGKLRELAGPASAAAAAEAATPAPAAAPAASRGQ